MTSICWPIWISHNVLCASPHFTLPCEILIPCQKTLQNFTNFTKYKTRLRDRSYIVSLKCRWLSRQLGVWIADNQDHKIRQSTGFGSKIKTVGGHVPIWMKERFVTHKLDCVTRLPACCKIKHNSSNSVDHWQQVLRRQHESIKACSQHINCTELEFSKHSSWSAHAH